MSCYNCHYEQPLSNEIFNMSDMITRNGDGIFMLDGGGFDFDLIAMFHDWLEGKVCEDVRYEYCRVARKFLEKCKNIPIKKEIPIRFNEEQKAQRQKEIMELQSQIDEFLNIEQPDTYRNTLAAIRKLFEFLHIDKEYLQAFKYKQVLPTFNIEVRTLEQVREFGKCIQNRKVRVYYYLGTVSAIRPKHLLRLTKGLFDKSNNMIRTWQKEYGRKNFFFSYYTDEVKPLIEAYLDELPTEDSKLFPIGYRFIQDEFERASKKSGIKITPKDCRKFATNWLRRHGLLQEDVDILTGHVQKSRIVILHYLDHSRLQQDYRRAVNELKLL